MIEHYTIQSFSAEWWFVTLTLSVVIYMVIYLAKISNANFNSNLTKIIGFILLSRFVLIHPYQHYHLDIWSLQSSLPLHLCGISAFLSGLLMFWKNQIAYECLFYWGLCGAFHSLLTPEMTNGSQGLLYFEYYLSHGGIVLAALYLTFVVGMKPRKNSWLFIFIYSQGLIPTIGLINTILDSNYLYLSSPPDANNPIINFIRLQPQLIYIIFIDFIALLHFYFIYKLFNFNIENKVVYND